MPGTAPLHALAGVHPDVWHADTLAGAPARVLATGDALLDAQLPGGGWPLGALNEILQPAGVHSEWRLLLSALARSGTGAVVLVGAPHTPFSPALGAQGLAPSRLLWVAPAGGGHGGGQGGAQRLWATEQALRCADVDAVLAWLVQVRPEQLRRLQMAAAEFDKLLFVVRPEQAQAESSPAALRLWVAPSVQQADALEVRALKRRGPPMSESLHLAARPARLLMLLAASMTPTAVAWGRPGGDLECPYALDRTAACV